MSTARPTIAAISSGSGGGVGIVRISGPQAESIARRICQPVPQDLVSHRLYLGHVFAPSEAPPIQAHEANDAAPSPPGLRRDPRAAVDQVLFCLMRGPHSYTGEDVLELHGHGGARNLRRLLDACLAAGAQAAGPGEFTRRAFLAGKIDLTRAEAVATLIEAQSDQALRHAQRQLAGELGQTIAELRRRVVELLAEFEGRLDFPEAEDEDPATAERCQRALRGLHAQVQRLGNSFRQGGKAVSGGVEIAVIGRPNVGKSSLINALCGSERVLVDAQPGTTRDFVEVRSDWPLSPSDAAQPPVMLPVVLIDTAGQHEAASHLEQHGMRLARTRLAHADLLLFVVDGTMGITPEDAQLLAELPADRPRLVLWNKIDRKGCLPPPEDRSTVRCSALCGWGLDTLRRTVAELLAPRLSSDDEVLVTSARQAALLTQTATALSQALAALSDQPQTATVLVAGELRVAAARLSELQGDDVQEGVLDAIFSRFCVGK
ncbi:MAG: tRNA uridine-5-carboxymethylaminomethyl(34) synthesis GTPase MnmE [Myxococcales bacterium]|nr:tRNA uridine-5-carboxymethylaminomethyl(34) synthesis GTPase MnmE [Myxococcales bacterium]